ncbi:MAG: hypothetical protein V3V56_04395 [bacterium]
MAPFQSKKDPFPLGETEEALLVAAGAGITGVALADIPYTDWEGIDLTGNLLIQFTGRTYPSPCSSHGTELFFTNDSGTYFVDMRGKQPTKMLEYETPEDRRKVLDLFRSAVVKLSDTRLNPPALSHLPWNRWHVNQPGTTMFIPVSDVTWQYINGLMVALEARGSYIYDDLSGNAEPLRSFADRGWLDRSRAVPLSAVEQRIALQIIGIEQSTMLHNMALAAQAIGLGSFVFPAMDPSVIFGAPGETGGLGFRHIMPHPQPDHPGWLPPPRPAPVGLDGVFESYSPPYRRDMCEAVRAVYAAKWGEEGIYTNEGIESGLKDRAPLATGVPRTPEWVVEATEALCSYLWETYGRVPVTVDPMSTLLWFQALHLDTDFYDQYYQPGAYTGAIRDHMKNWHPERE